MGLNGSPFLLAVCIQWIQHFAHTELRDYNSMRSLLSYLDNESIGYAVNKPKDCPNGSKPRITKHKSYRSCIPTYLLSSQYDATLQGDVNGEFYFYTSDDIDSVLNKCSYFDAPEDIHSELERYGCYVNFETFISDIDPLYVFWDLGQGFDLKNNHNDVDIIQDILRVYFRPVMIIVLQQDRNNMAIIKYTYSKTREKQRSTFNRDSNRPSNRLRLMTIKSSKDSNKGVNKSSESKCSVNKCASYTHKLIKFNSMSQLTTQIEYDAQIRNTPNVQRSFDHHHTSKTFSVNTEKSPPLTRLSRSHGQFFTSYGERCQHQPIPHDWFYASYGIKKEESYLLHSPSKDSPSDILSKFWSHQTPYDLIKPFMEMKVLSLVTQHISCKMIRHRSICIQIWTYDGE